MCRVLANQDRVIGIKVGGPLLFYFFFLGFFFSKLLVIISESVVLNEEIIGCHLCN